MAGLLASLDAQLDAGGLKVSLDAQGTVLGAVVAAVDALKNGPSLLADLQATMHSLPSPPALGDFGGLAAALSGAASGMPTDFVATLAPLIEPLTGLKISVDVRIDGLAAIVEVVQRVVALATGQALTGALPLPSLTGALGMPDAPSPFDPDAVRARLDAVKAMIGAFGPHLDAAQILQVLKATSAGGLDGRRKWPSLPLVGEVVEAMETVVAWENQSPADLTAGLASSVRNAAILIRTPREWIAQPVIRAATLAATSPSLLGDGAATLDPLLARFATDDPLAEPSRGELAVIAAQVEKVEALAEACDPAATPLAHLDQLHHHLELQLLRVVRSLEPLVPTDGLADEVRKLTARIPAPVPEPLGGLVKEIHDLDLSFLTAPMGAVRDAVQKAVDTVHSKFAEVQAAIEKLLAPVDKTLGDAVAALHLDQLKATLAALPTTIKNFVETEIKPKVKPVHDAIAAAVAAVSSASDAFDPARLIAPIKDAIDRATRLLAAPEVKATFEHLNAALDGAVSAIQNLRLHAAADETVARLGKIESKLKGINPALIPNAAKPVLRQAVDAVTKVNLRDDVVAPVVKQVQDALQHGPAQVLAALEGQMAELKRSLERFRPSVAIGHQLDEPFQKMMDVLHGFQPSDLLAKLVAALHEVASALHVVDPSAVMAPLVEAHHKVAAAVDGLKPSTLLKPVTDAAAEAVKKVVKAAHLDEVFDGLDKLLARITGYLSLLSATGDVLRKLGALLTQPGEVDAALDSLVEATVARLDVVQLADLQAAFAEAAAAAHAIEQPALAAEISTALKGAADHAPAALASPAAAHLRQLAVGFPLATLRGRTPTPSLRELGDLVERLVKATARLEKATPAWSDLAPRLAALAPEVQPRLATYARITRLEGGSVFREFLTPPADVGQLKEAVGATLREGLRVPVAVLFGVFKALAPHIGGLANGIADLIDAIQAKLDALVGEGGIGGVAKALEEAADLLRHFDLSPLVTPLDKLHARVAGAVAALDPSPIAAAVHAAADEVARLLDLSLLIGADEVAQLNQAYGGAVAKLEQLAPSKVVAAVLDPMYEQALGPVGALLDLPGKLKILVDAGSGQLGDDLVREFGRVEVAFDNMLRAIPLQDTDQSASVSVSAHAQVA